MQLLSDITGLLAPNTCLSCGAEGAVLCSACLETAGQPPPSRCVGCHALTENYQICSDCRRWIPITSVHVATVYEGVYEQLIHAYKFDMQRSAARPIGAMMVDVLPALSSDTVLCPLPTAPSRIRERGFDHTKILVRELVFKTHLGATTDLKRRSNRRQLGATRAKRIEQMKDEFYVKDVAKIAGRVVLLVDDVVTTGASLSAAAKVLRKAGAKSVRAVVFAQKM